jgi:hypothetical protein
VSDRKKGRPRATETEPRAYIRWINGRAYAELGGWAAWGGRRQEPLRASGEAFATNDPSTAAMLLGCRLTELREKREAERKIAAATPTVPTSIAAFIGYHLACKAQVVGRHRPSGRDLDLQRTRLIHVGKFFLRLGLRDVRQITGRTVAAYMEHLQEAVGSAPGHTRQRVEYLSPATQRKYLRTLGNMLKRARSKGLIATNFVEDLLANCD